MLLTGGVELYAQTYAYLVIAQYIRYAVQRNYWLCRLDKKRRSGAVYEISSYFSCSPLYLCCPVCPVELDDERL